MDIAAVTAGGALLLLVGVDVFFTVLHPQGHGGPLTRHLNHVVWRSWRRVAAGSRRRDAWLATAGPALSVLTPAVWAVALVGGFALIYYPWIPEFMASPGSLRGPWVEALYFSGVSAATLGTGDIVPDPVWLRMISIVEALSGFALLSASLTYMLSIHTAHTVKTTLASDIASHLEANEREPGSFGEQEAWLERSAERLLHVMHAHAQYPILHYFRPARRQDALAVQVGHLVDRVFDESRKARASQTHGERVLMAAVERYLSATEDGFLPDRIDGAPAGDGPAARHGRLLAYLGYADWRFRAG